jgi:threonine/homoserine/homoserine lactone efflux protein
MDFSLLLKGLVMGFSIAAPVGPVGLLCIRRTLAKGRLAGLVSGLGAASADGIYGLLAGLGIGALAELLVSGQVWLRLGGGILLILLGLQTFFSQPALTPAAASSRGLLGDYFSTLALTLSNPLTILSFAAVFASLGLTSQGAYSRAVAGLVSGVFCGSAAWWLLLSGAVGLLRERITPVQMRWVNRVSGLLILGFGAWTVLSGA